MNQDYKNFFNFAEKSSKFLLTNELLLQKDQTQLSNIAWEPFTARLIVNTLLRYIFPEKVKYLYGTTPN